MIFKRSLRTPLFFGFDSFFRCVNPALLFVPLAVMLISCTRTDSGPVVEGLPNIVIIYTDDVGYGDVGAYGAVGVETPNLDRLAEGGLKFTNAYATSAICTPSRYSLLTGEHHWRMPPGGWHVGDLEGTGIAPGDAGLIIDPSMETLPSILQQAGYVTAVIGKWHLGLGPVEGADWNGEITPGPVDVGFDESFLIPSTGDRVPTVYVENGRVVGLDPEDPIRVSFTEAIGHDSTIYNPGVTPDRIVSYPPPPDGDPVPDRPGEDIRMHPSFGHDQTIVNGIPRIGYMTGGYAARWKDEEIADRITEKALEFIDTHHEHPFFLYFSTHDIHVPRVPHERFAGESDIGVYGDVIMQMDWSVGQIMERLEEYGLTGRTLVIFSSDNGPVLDDGYHDGSVEETGEHRPAGPYRGGKYSAFEGGSKIPFIVHWPERVEPGVTDALFSQVDLLASVAALIGHQDPDGIHYDSINHLSALLGEDSVGREMVIHQNMGGTLSLIRGEWKYIEPGDGPALNPYTRPMIEMGNDPEPQLYNLRDDPGETRNLAETHPGMVRELAGLLEKLKRQEL